MAGRARLVLLDAGAVFAALEHDAWEVLTAIGYSKPLAAKYGGDFVERNIQKGFERKLRR